MLQETENLLQENEQDLAQEQKRKSSKVALYLLSGGTGATAMTAGNMVTTQPVLAQAAAPTDISTMITQLSTVGSGILVVVLGALTVFYSIKIVKKYLAGV